MRTKTLTLIFICFFTLPLLAGCESSNPKRDTGIVTGAIVGGLLGNQIGHGRGRTAATIIGTIAAMAAFSRLCLLWVMLLAPSIDRLRRMIRCCLYIARLRTT
jgi:hypothetical protein